MDSSNSCYCRTETNSLNISLSIAAHLYLTGFIADEYGSYVVAFYAAGGIGLFSACLPFTLLCVTPTAARKEIVLGQEGLEE